MLNNNFIRFILGMIVLGIAALLYMYYSIPAHATQINNDFSIVICHHTPGNNVTKTFNNLQSYLGHLGTPHSGQTFDTDGACASPSPSPTPSSTPHPTRTPHPSHSPKPTIDPCVTVDVWEIEKDHIEYPCPSPTPLVTHTDQPEAGQSGQLAPTNTDWSAPVCSEIKFTPTILEVKRNNPTSIHVSWSKVDEFVSDYVVDYSLGKDIWLWRTIVHGNDTDLNYLPFNHLLWIKVAGTFNGCLGNFSQPVDP